ncbi:hypothetical protein [Paraburkholderia sp. DHOC27]|uniref:hypothetical protein n=1 Tax=Paraburkholderia sp. DHOC27 TaxID=2303330 RepID=UPI000E3CD757|nr:hypothetical protein [Paraburkholderia sp. DHOC27]RFU49659.1 hypothetical protein D0B32_07745 [Paraburkholderia sp. DHOC27]
MKRTIAAVLFVTASASMMSSAQASGYGPAPFYHPDAGSTFPRHRHCAKTVGTANGTQSATDTGGVAGWTAQSGEAATPPVGVSSGPKQ